MVGHPRLLVMTAVFVPVLLHAQVPSFHTPAPPTGSITLKLCPMENVTPGSTRLVTFDYSKNPVAMHITIASQWSSNLTQWFSTTPPT